MSTILTADRRVDISDIKTVNEIANVSLRNPQVQAELENLKATTDRIKKLETELDRARSDFRCLLSESSSKVNDLSKKLRSCVEKAKLCREARIYAREWLIEAETTDQLEHQQILPAHDESERIVEQLQQELKKSITKSCLSTRRNLLQLNNLANQHQLQLLPYFEMKAQFNQMFDEQIKKVPSIKEAQFHLQNSNDEIPQQWKFQDLLDYGRTKDDGTKASNSVISSYEDSLSSENVYLEHLTSEDMYMALPPNLKLTPGLINCTVSYSGNSCFKSSNDQSTDRRSVENSISQRSHEILSYRDILCPSDGDNFNGAQHDIEALKQSSNNNLNDTANKMSQISLMLPNAKSSDSDTSIPNLNSDS